MPSRKAGRLQAISKDVSLRVGAAGQRGVPAERSLALAWKGPKCHPSLWERNRGLRADSGPPTWHLNSGPITSWLCVDLSAVLTLCSHHGEHDHW